MTISRLHRRIVIIISGITLLAITLACSLPFQSDVSLTGDENLATNGGGKNDIPSKVITEVAATLLAPQQATFTIPVIEPLGTNPPPQTETQILQTTEVAIATSNVPTLSTPYPAITTVTFAVQTGKDINITDVFLRNCGGIATVKFLVENVGAQAIESLSLQLMDLNVNQDISDQKVTDAPFTEDGQICKPGGLSRLEPGESLYVSSPLGSDQPSGHTILANFFFCTQDGLNGQCYPRSVEFLLP